MKTLRALRFTALVLTASVSTGAHAAPCPPVADVDGDDVLASELRDALAARGVTNGESPAECSRVRAVLREKDARLVLEIHDSFGRLEVRDVSGVELAAQLVEGWARMDLTAPLLDVAPKLEPAPRMAVLSRQAPVTEPVGRLDAAPSLFAVDARGEVGADEAGALWLGARVATSMNFDVWSPFLSVRGATSRRRALLEGTDATRAGLEVLAGAAVELELGTVTLSPALALGAGWTSTARTNDGRPEGCDVAGEGRVCPPGVSPRIDDQLRQATISPRVEGAVSLGVPLGAGFSLSLGASLSLSPFAHDDAFVPSYARDLSPPQQARFSIAGEPMFVGRGSIGLTWEVP